MSEIKHSKGVNLRGDTLVCVDYHKPQNHIYIGLDFHGNRKCCCGGMPPKAGKTYEKSSAWKSLKEINAMMPGSGITPSHPDFARIMMRRCALHMRQDIHPEFIGTLEQRGKSATKYLRWAIEYRDISRRNQQLKRKGI